MLIVVSLVASTTFAKASGDAIRQVPIPPERPLLLDFAPTLSKVATDESSRSRRFRHGRGSRPADAIAEAKPDPSTPAPISTNTEAAAATPAAKSEAIAEGQRETAAPTLADLVTRHARDNGVPVSLAQAVVRIESRGNPRASNGGALGLMQIKPATARAVGFNGGASALFVADTNLHFGMKVLGEAFRSSGGDVCRALMLYQSGHLATRMTRSNRAYCTKARAIMAGA